MQPSHYSCFELPSISPEERPSGEQDCWVSGSSALLKWQKAAETDLRIETALLISLNTLIHFLLAFELYGKLQNFWLFLIAQYVKL